MYTICCPGWILLTLRTLALQRGNNSIFPCCELFGHCRWSWWINPILAFYAGVSRGRGNRVRGRRGLRQLGNWETMGNHLKSWFVLCAVSSFSCRMRTKMKRKRKKKRRRGLRDTEIYRDIQRYTEIYRDIRRLHNHNSELYRCETNRLNVHHIVVGFWEWKLSPKSLAQEPTSDESVESEDWIGLVPIGYFKPVISFSHTFSTYVSLQFITYVHIVSG